jgi:predicted MFS family arabinose efflux permease
MSFLHCFYGVGVTVSPFILTIVFRNDTNWRIGYGIAAIIQFAIAAIVIFSLPLWNRVRDKNEISESAIKSLSVIEASKIRGVKVMWLLFLCTCSIELTVGTWSSTFLVESRGATEELAAGTITFYYLGMTSGRFLSGVLARKIHSRTIITIGSVILGIALLMLTITNNSYIAIAALFLIGAQMAVANIGIVISPLLFGFLGQALGMGLFGYYLLFFYFFLVIGVILNRKQFRKNE